MELPHPQRITGLLNDLRTGNRAAEPELITLIYPELRKIAARFMRRERSGHTLQPTALVNEVYLRMAGHHDPIWQNRSHFFAVAAQLMRAILVDHARKKQAAKRGGNPQRIEMDVALPVTNVAMDSMIDVDNALRKLSEWDARQANIVVLHIFGGLTEEEIAEVLAISVRTVKRDWRMAKAWLLGILAPRQTLP